MMQKTPINVMLRPDFVASANYTGIAMYDVAEQTRRSTRRRARRRGVTCADGNCAEENGTHTEKSTPPLITGYAWIDSSIPLDKEELKKLAIVTKRLSQTWRPSDPLLDGLLCSLRYSTRGGPAPRGGSKYEWEQGTLVSFRSIVEKLAREDSSAVIAHELVKGLVVSLVHMGVNVLLELWDAFWDVTEMSLPCFLDSQNSIGSVVGWLSDAVSAKADDSAFLNFSKIEGKMRFWYAHLGALLSPGRFRIICCPGCSKALSVGDKPRWNILSHYKPNIPVLLQDRWLDNFGRASMSGCCSSSYDQSISGWAPSKGDTVFWRDMKCVVTDVAPTNLPGGIEIEVDNHTMSVEPCFLRASRITEMYPSKIQGEWPTWAAGTVRERDTGRPYVVRQPSKRILTSVLSFVRCIFEVNRVESSSAKARNARDGVVSRPNNNPALNYSSVRHAICMYKLSCDDTGFLKSAYDARSLPALHRACTTYLFRHAGPAFSREQLIEQIRDSKVYEVDKREALLWRGVLQTCHPEWSAITGPGQVRTSSINEIVDSMPDNSDVAGWRAVTEECIQMAALAYDTAESSSEAGSSAAGPGVAASGSVQSLLNASGNYSESLETMIDGEVAAESFRGYGEEGTITSGIIGASQIGVTEKSLRRVAGSRIVSDSPPVLLQGSDPVSEYKNAHRLDSCIHPYLIWNGGGAARDKSREEEYRPGEMFKYENKLMWRGYARHPTRNFYTCDVINRHTDLNNARFMVEHAGVGTQRLSTEELVKWSTSIQTGVPLSAPEKRRVETVRSGLRAIGAKRRGSQYDRQSKKGILDAYELTLGTANCFWTFNLSEGRDPRISIMLGIIDADGARHAVEHVVRPGPVTTAEQIIGVARDPYRVAEWYDLMLKAVTSELLVPEGTHNDKCGPDGKNEPRRLSRGIMGTLVAFYGVNENAQRMSMHTHLKLWLAEMRFVQRATQTNDITLRHLETVMARFVESLTSALLLGHDDMGEARFDGSFESPVLDVMKAVDLEELSFKDVDGYNVADCRPSTAPSETELCEYVSKRRRTCAGGYEHSGRVVRDEAGGISGGDPPDKTATPAMFEEAAFGKDWFNRVVAEARDRVMDTNPQVSFSEALDTVAGERRRFVNPNYTGDSRDRNDVDEAKKGSTATSDNVIVVGGILANEETVAHDSIASPSEERALPGGGCPPSVSALKRPGARGPRKPLYGKVIIRALGRSGPTEVSEFEMESATAMSRLEIQALMHGTRRRTSKRTREADGRLDASSNRHSNDVSTEVRRECSPCCFKTREAKRRNKCRLRFGPNGRVVVDFTYFDDDGIIRLVRNHGHLVPNSKTATLVLRVNNRSVACPGLGRDLFVFDVPLV